MDASACASCGQPVTREELANGLAVRVDGRLVCPQCVDGLPGEAQVRINQVRALRGLSATTYRVENPRHPALQAYTFTTSVNVLHHRRDLVAGRPFAAPPLPPRHQRPALPPDPGRAAAAPGRNRLLIGGIAGVVVAGGGIALALALSGGERPTTPTAPLEVVQRVKQRVDYALEPARAWQEAVADSECPDDLRQAIAAEVVAEATRRLDEAERALDAGDRERADAALAAGAVPDHLLFRAVASRRAALQRRRDALASAPPPVRDPTPPAPVEPRSAPAPEAPNPVEPPSAPEVAKPAPATQPPATTVAPPAPTPPPSTDRLVAKAGELPEIGDGWRRHTGSLHLQSESGTIAGTTTVAGGRYQAWLRVKSGEAPVTVQVVLGEVRCAPLALAPSRSAEWLRLAPAAIDLPAGPLRVQIAALGKGCGVYEFYLAGAASPDDVGTPPAAEMAWQPAADKPDQRAARPTPAKDAPWQPRVTGAPTPLDPLDEKSRIPPGLPGNPGPVVESLTKGRRPMAVTVDLAGGDSAGGGLVLLVHPVRADRRELAVTVIDAGERKATLPALPLAAGRWNTVVIPFAGLAGADPARVRQVVLEDTGTFSTSFLVAKAAAVAGRAPTEADLQLRPLALQPLEWNDLERALAAVAQKRKSRNWRRDLDPALIKVLIGHHLTMGEFDERLRAGLEELLAEPLKKGPLPRRTVEKLVLSNAWLDALVKPPTGDTPVLDPAKHHLAILCTAGVEFPIGLTEPQAFINLWQKLIDEVVGLGVLPVVVLGPNKVDSDDAGEVEKLWLDLEAWLRRNRPGIPIIDLRPAKAISYERFAPNMSQLATDLLLDGYGDLYRRILRLKAVKER